MAITYPLSLAKFWGWLPVSSAPPKLGRQEEHSGKGSGRIISAELASPLWRADVQLNIVTRDEEGSVTSLIDALDGAQKSFLFSPKARPYPIDDPNGTILGGSTPVIETIGADNKSISISGLPDGYQLRAGDFLSFVISGRPHLHRLAEDGVADGSGVTPEIELRPHLRPGAVAALDVTLINPVCEMIIEPDSYDPGARKGLTLQGVRFTAVQKL